MKRKAWLLGALGLLAGGVVVCVAVLGQTNTRLKTYDANDVYRLLVNDEGQNRLAALQSQIDTLTTELNDVTAKLNAVQAQLVDAKGRSVSANLLELMHWVQLLTGPYASSPYAMSTTHRYSIPEMILDSWRVIVNHGGSYDLAYDGSLLFDLAEYPW